MNCQPVHLLPSEFSAGLQKTCCSGGRGTNYARPHFGKKTKMVLESQCCLLAARESRTSPGRSTYISRWHIPSGAQVEFYHLCNKRFIGARKNNRLELSCFATSCGVRFKCRGVSARARSPACKYNLSSAARSPFPPSLAHTQIMLFTLCQSLPLIHASLSIRSHLCDILEWRHEEAPPHAKRTHVYSISFFLSFLRRLFEASSLLTWARDADPSSFALYALSLSIW